MKLNNRFIFGILSLLLAAVIAFVALPTIARQTNGKEEISSKLTKTYVPQFRAKASGYGSFKQGVPFKLYVTLQGRTAEFSLTSDGKVTVSAVDKV